MRLVERPEPLPDGARLLHIGLPKTGTTALQAALHAAREELESRGVHNVSKSRNPLSVARYAAGRSAGTAQERRRWARMAEDFATSTARQTLLSSEALCAAEPEAIAALRNQLGDDVHVVVTLRSLTPLLPSLWQQGLRIGETASFEQWVKKVLQPAADGGFRVGGYDVGRIIADWGRVFGEDRLVFVIGDPSDREFNLRTFERLLGAPDVLELQPVANASPPYPEIELLRHFNLVHGRTGENAARWTKVMRMVGRHMGDNPHAATGSQRITAPRWVAEAANEHDGRAIAALEASDALVVGDPKYLLTDPEGQPDEVPPPDQVTMESAAWFADLVSRTALEQWEAAAARERRQSRNRRGPAGPQRRPDLDDVPGRELARALVRRARARVRR